MLTYKKLQTTEVFRVFSLVLRHLLSYVIKIRPKACKLKHFGAQFFFATEQLMLIKKDTL